MICKKCGENLPDNARECFTCGAKVKRNTAVADTGVNTTVKKEVKAVDFFKQIFSTEKFFILILLFTVSFALSLLTLALSIFGSTWTSVVSNIIDVAISGFLAYFLWKLYTHKSTQPQSYIGIFKVMRFYPVLSGIGTIVLTALIDLIYMVAFAVTFDVSIIVGAVIGSIVMMYPYYSAFKFIDSLRLSAVNDRVKVDKVKTLTVFCMALAVFSVIAFIFGLIFPLELRKPTWYDIYASIADFISDIIRIATLFLAYDWFTFVRNKLKWL